MEDLGFKALHWPNNYSSEDMLEFLVYIFKPKGNACITQHTCRQHKPCKEKKKIT